MDQEITPDALDWMEGKALANIEAKRALSASITRAGELTATVLLAAVTGLSAYAAGIISQPVTSAAGGAALLVVYLAALIFLVVNKTLVFGRVPAAGQEPIASLEDAGDMQRMRLRYLKQLQQDIERWSASNNERAPWLNRVRRAAALSPVVAVLGALAVQLI